MIRFLKDLEVPVKTYMTCGDGCCSWYENDGMDHFKEGEEVDEWTVDISNLDEGVDYEEI